MKENFTPVKDKNFSGQEWGVENIMNNTVASSSDVKSVCKLMTNIILKPVFLSFGICIYLFRPIIIHMIADSSFIIPFRQVTLFMEPTNTIYTDKFIKLLYML